MSDDRLFASNNAIGRRGYVVNIIVLALIIHFTHNGFIHYIIPNVVNAAYETITTWVLYFAYFIFAIAFFSLIERRLFDVCGKRDTQAYKTVSSILQLDVFAIILLVLKDYIPFLTGVSNHQAQTMISLLGFIVVLIVLILIFPKGKISNLSYEEYRKQDKYR